MKWRKFERAWCGSADKVTLSEQHTGLAACPTASLAKGLRPVPVAGLLNDPLEGPLAHQRQEQQVVAPEALS